MKKLNNIYLALVCAFFATSCNYDESDKIAGQGPNIVKFEAVEGTFTSVFNTPAGEVNLIQIRRDAKSNAVLSTSTKFDFVIDNSIVTKYNTDATQYNLNLDSDGDGIDDLDPKPIYVVLDASSYTIGSSLTFEAGETIKPIKMTVSGLDLSTPYAVGIKLNNPPAEWVNSGNNSAVLINIVIQNQYDAVYVVSGTRWNFNTAAEAVCGSSAPPSGSVSSSTFTFEYQFTTVGANSNAMAAGNIDGGFGDMIITTNADNTISIDGSDVGLNEFKQSVCYSSKYDPIAKTYSIYEQWTNTTGTHRIVEKFLVRK